MLGEAEARAPEPQAGELPLSPPPLLRQVVAGVALGDLLERLVRSVERAMPGSIASVLLVMDGHLRLGAAPNLPEAYNRAADNHPIGEGYGACGTAAHRGALVICADLQVDPLWKNYRDIARRYELGACWSMPIVDQAGTVLGTLAVYSRKPRGPRADELEVMREHADLALLAIEGHQVRAALAEREQGFHELVDALDGIAWEAQPGGRRFGYVSRQAERLFGYPARRWLEPGFWASILHPEDRDITLRRDREAAHRPGAFETQYRLCTASGDTVWVRDTASVRGDRVTGIRRVRGVMINITSQRRAEIEREEAFQRRDQAPAPARPAPPAAPAPAASLETRTLIEAGTTLGMSLEPDVIAQHLADLAVPGLADWSLVVLSGEGKLRCAAVAHREREQGAVRVELDRLLDQPGGVPFRIGALLEGARGQLFPELPGDAFPDGAVRPELLRLLRSLGASAALTAPLPARTGVVGALVWVSASPGRRFGARDLALAEELGRRAALALENARLFRDAQAEVLRREEFLSIAAHELMTPVASLLLTVQTIVEALGQQPPDLEFAQGRAQAGERQGVRLGRLVNELLDVSRIRAGRMELIRTNVDLAAVVHLVVGRFREEIARKGIDVTVHAPAPALGRWDQSRIEQIVSNLLSNAIKYGDRQPVLITLGQDADQVTLEVADRGIGMDPAFLPRLFHPFERGVSAGHYGGLGLGLYIAAQNVEAHGGRISVRSAPGQGSTFTVELPRRAPAET